MNKAIKTKKKILNALQDLKEYELTWVEEITYSKIVKAKDEDEVENKFFNGEITGTSKDIIENKFIEDTLEIEKVE